MKTSTRREFLLTGATAAAAATALPRLSAAERRTIGYCIVGLGRVSIFRFLPGLRYAPHARPVALVSRDPRIAAIVALRHGIAARNIYSYADFERIADNREIEAVYIALPNALHAEYSIRAARAGKHVLCEKPMAASVEQAEHMVEACHRAQRKLMIAYRCQYEPVTLRARALTRSGALGQPQIIVSRYGFNISPTFRLMGETRPEWRLKRALAGGGPLMDVGIYGLNASRFISGEEPSAIQAEAGEQPGNRRFREIEENLAWSMRFPSGLTAACATSYGSNLGEGFQLFGAHNASLTLDPAFGYASHRLHVQGAAPLDFSPDFDYHRQFGAEAEHFAQCILQNRVPRSPGEEGLRDLRLIARIYAAAGRPF